MRASWSVQGVVVSVWCRQVYGTVVIVGYGGQCGVLWSVWDTVVSVGYCGKGRVLWSV